MERVIIYGVGKTAQDVYAYFAHGSPYRVAAFTVAREYLEQEKLYDLEVVPFEDVERRFPPRQYKMFIALGTLNLNKVRAEKCVQAKRKGYQLISYVSPKASTRADLVLGENCLIAEMTVVQPHVEIGDNVLIYSGVFIGHYCKIGDHCFIAPHVVLGGGITLGTLSVVGMNATIKENVKVRDECVVGAGALILNDTKEKGVYRGNSAPLMKLRSDNKLIHLLLG